jgi:hypothetical protein
LQGKKQEIEKQEYTVLDEITEKEIPKEPENQNVQQQEQQVPQTPASVVRRSTRLSIPYWLWSLIIFLIQRSLLSAMFIPHEVFAP